MPRIADLAVPRGRLDAISDGVYAFAVTLLVLELRLPPLAQGATDSTLVQALLGVMPKALIWLLSFWVTALQWTSSVRLSRLVGDDGVPTLKLELSQLALVSLVPFTTSVMGDHGDLGSAAALYSGHLCALALLAAARVTVALPAHAAGVDTATAGARCELLTRSWLAVACAALALALAFVVPGWNMLALLPLALHARLLRRMAGKTRR